MLSSAKVLIVEDDDTLAEVLELHLAAEGCEVLRAVDGESALSIYREKLPGIVVLDLMLPGQSGLEVCAELRTFRPCPAVLMLTARGEEADVVLGFAQGADDYVVKPCRPREVVARVNALARRVMPSRNEAAEVLTFGRLRIDSARRTVTVDGSALGLTPMEFALLHYLAGNPGRVSPRLELLRSLWKTQVESYARNVDCHVTRLRRKLEESGLRPAPLRTVHGVGYVFEPPGGP